MRADHISKTTPITIAITPITAQKTRTNVANEQQGDRQHRGATRGSFPWTDHVTRVTPITIIITPIIHSTENREKWGR